MTQVLKPLSSFPLTQLLKRLPLPILKQFHQLGNIRLWVFGSHSHSNHHPAHLIISSMWEQIVFTFQVVLIKLVNDFDFRFVKLLCYIKCLKIVVINYYENLIYLILFRQQQLHCTFLLEINKCCPIFKIILLLVVTLFHSVWIFPNFLCHKPNED